MEIPFDSEAQLIQCRGRAVWETRHEAAEWHQRARENKQQLQKETERNTHAGDCREATATISLFTSRETEAIS